MNQIKKSFVGAACLAIFSLSLQAGTLITTLVTDPVVEGPPVSYYTDSAVDFVAGASRYRIRNNIGELGGASGTSFTHDDGSTDPWQLMSITVLAHNDAINSATEPLDGLTLRIFNGESVDLADQLGSDITFGTGTFDAGGGGFAYLTLDLTAAETADIGDLAQGAQYTFTLSDTTGMTDIRISRLVSNSYAGGSPIFSGAFRGGAEELVFYIESPNANVELSTTAVGSVAGDFTVDIDFSEDVTGLDASDFAVTNGTASSLSGSGSAYSITITPTASGMVDVELPAGVVLDVDSDSNFASNLLSVLSVLSVDSQATVTLSTIVTEPVAGSYDVDVVFSEDVTGVDASDFTVANGVVTGITPEVGPASNYTVTIEPNIDGDVMVTLVGAGVIDVDDSLQTEDSNTLTTAFVAPAAPTLTFTNPSFPEGLITNATFTLEIDFTEDVTGLDLSDFMVTNGTVSNLVTVSARAYDIDITPTGSGSVIVDLPANSVTDTDSEGNPRAVSISHILDTGEFNSGVLDLSGRDVDGLGVGESLGFFASPKTFDSVSDLSLNDIPWTDGTNSGTFDLSLVATSSLAGIQRGGKGAFGAADLMGDSALIQEGESIVLGSLVASDLQGDLAGLSITDVQIIAVYLGNATLGDDATINGLPAIGSAGGTTTLAMRNNILYSQMAEVIGAGLGDGFSLNGIEISYRIGAAPLTLEIVACGFAGDDFFIELAGGTAGLKVTSADLLDFSSSTDVSATVDPGNSNRFLIPSSERTASRDFFRVEEQ